MRVNYAHTNRGRRLLHIEGTTKPHWATGPIDSGRSLCGLILAFSNPLPPGTEPTCPKCLKLNGA